MRSACCLALFLSVSASCRCTGLAKPIELEALEVAPARLTFPATFVGSSSRLVVEVVNPNVVERRLEAVIEGPFTMAEIASVAAGESLALDVVFRPTQVGPAHGRLVIESREVVLVGEGLAVPTCSAMDQCHDARFDEARAACVSEVAPDGRDCSTRCLPTGSCVRGECLGTTPTCDDQNACTVDACNAQLGCIHARRTCPRPVDRCKRAQCDSATGCVVVDAPDGTLCGADDCAVPEVDVCLAGRCVRRARPASARCSNTWLPVTVPRHGRGASLAAFDEASGLVLLVVNLGTTTQTWRWDGTDWELLFPLTALPSLIYAAMVADPSTGGLVVVGRAEAGFEQWEWDGSNWFSRGALPGIDCDGFASLAVEPLTQRLLLSCYQSTTRRWSLWSSDSVVWRREPDPPWSSEPEFVVDPATSALLAVTHASANVGETYQWLFPGFVKRPLARTMVDEGCGGVDPLTHEAVWFEASSPGMRRWRWRANAWVDEGDVALDARRDCLTVLDTRRNRLVLSGGSFFTHPPTWEWDGQRLLERAKATPQLYGTVLATGPSPFVFGNASTTETKAFRFGGRSWEPSAPLPSALRVVAAAWDDARSHFVVSLVEPTHGTKSTWSFDGGTWQLVEQPSATPFLAKAAWSSALGRVFSFGDPNASDAGGLFFWTGVTWQGPSTPNPPGTWGSFAVSTDSSGAPLITRSGLDTEALETFRWSDGGWQPLPAPPFPPAMAAVGLVARAAAYDPQRQRTILLALPADPAQGGLLTFEWSGSAWVTRSPTLSPPRDANGELAFDSNTRRVVLYDPRQTWAFFP